MSKHSADPGKRASTKCDEFACDDGTSCVCGDVPTLTALLAPALMGFDE